MTYNKLRPLTLLGTQPSSPQLLSPQPSHTPLDCPGTPTSVASDSKLIPPGTPPDAGSPPPGGAELPPRPTPPVTAVSFLHPDAWLIETLALVVSVLSVVGIAWILATYNNRPAGEWVAQYFGGSTLNSVVAALATITRSCLMVCVASVTSQCGWTWFSARNSGGSRRLQDLDTFDAASRGTWGSLKLLWRLKTTLHLAIIGALLTILTLPFGMLTQQLIALKSVARAVANDNSTSYVAATIPRVSEYRSYLPGYTQLDRLPGDSMLAAMYSGLLGTAAPSFSVTCSSGNCTWPTVPSLAVCGECKDMTFSQTCDESDQCTFTTQSGTNITKKGTATRPYGVSWVLTASKHSVHYDPDTRTTPYLAVFDVFGGPSRSYQWETDAMTSAQCALWVCVKGYDASVVGGAIQEVEHVEATWSTTAPAMQYEDNDWNFTVADMPGQLNVRPNHAYTLNGGTKLAMTNRLSRLLGAGAQVMSTDNFDYTNDYAQVLQGLTTSYDSPSASNSSSPISKWIKNFAAQMTYAIRTSRDATDEKAQAWAEDDAYYAGTVHVTETVYVVRWEWMVPIIGLVFLAVVYMVAGIASAYRSGVGPWKGSLLTALLITPDPSLRDGVLPRSPTGLSRNEAIAMQDAITKAVGSRRARMDRQSTGEWVFRRAYTVKK